MRNQVITLVVLCFTVFNGFPQILTSEVSIEVTNGVTSISGLVGIGTNAPSKELDVEGEVRWGSAAASSVGDGLLSMSSGWNGQNYPTLGSIDGNVASLIMLHNPHLPFRTDNSSPGFTGRAGIRMASDVNATSYWDMGLAGDFFHIYRSGAGEFFRISNNGNVGVGTTSPTAKLHVNGTIKAPATDWSDFVFKDDYELPTLEEVELYISKNGHLKDIPSEEEVKREDVDLTQMDSRLLQKIEELTLYVIEQNKENEQQQDQILKLEERIRQLEVRE